MAERLSDLADALWPHLARRVALTAGGGAGAALNVASPTDHGALTGLLDDDHPQYLTAGRGDGRYPALANWTTHIGDADAHHARLHVLASTSGLGADHTVSGLTAGQVLRASSATTAAFAQLAHGDLSGIGTNTHTQIDTHIDTADIHVAHSGVSILAGDGLTGGGDLSANRSLALASSVAGNGLTFTTGVLAVGAGAGLTVNANDVALTTPGTLTATSTNSSTGSHTHAIDSTIARSAITLTAGNGFAVGSGGDLTANRTFTLGTPGALSATTTDAVTTNSHTHSISTAAATTLTVATTNAVGSSASLARADHTHAIASSSNPGAASSILASTAAGGLTLVDMTVTSLTASRLMASDANDKLTSVSALSAWVAGTANRITVSDDGDGSITLSAPQDIHTSATPTFAGLIAPSLRPAADSTTALQLRTMGGTAILTVDTTNSRVGIGNTPAYKLDVSGDVRLTGALYADGGIVDFGADYFQEGATYLELKGAKPLYLNQTIQASGWSMSAGGALVSASSLSAASLALTGAATITGNLTVGSTVLQVNTAGTRVGINRAADQQFDLDVAGAIRGQYLVGKHAIQLAAATAVVHFDGPAPFNLDFTGSNASHDGVGATETGGVIYRPGKYGKALQMGQATTNRCANPSFETDTTTPAGWTGSSLTTTTTTIATDVALYGKQSLKLVNSTAAQDAFYFHTISGLSASTAYTISVWVNCPAFTAGAFSNRCLFAYDTANSGATLQTATLTAATNGWVRLQVTVTMTATPGNLQVRLYAPQGTIYYDGVQVEQFAYATPYCDGSLGQGHSWSGTPHASTSSRTATKLEYPIRMVNPQAGTIMMWVKVDGYNSNGGGLFGWGSANGTMDAFLNSVGSMVSRVGGATQNYVGSFGTGVWRHVAWTWDAAANKYRVFVDGLQQPQPTPVDYAYAAQPVHATALAVGGIAALSSTYTHNGLIEEFVLLDYAADPKLVRAIYESDAPVFVESSVLHWRSPSKAPIWVDEFGLWARGVSGGAILGLYGGDPRTVGQPTSWGGISMEENDIVIGRTSAPSYTALHWDDSAGELILGRQAAEHLSLVSGSVRIKNATTVYADLSGSTFVLGNVAEENLRLTTSGIEFRNATEVQGSLSATTWLLGKTGASENNVQITTSAISLRRGTTVYATLTGTDFQLGGNENVYVTPSALQLRNGTTVNAQLDGDTLTLGQTTGTHTLITSTSVQMKSGSNVHADLTGSTLTLGLTSSGDYLTVDGTNGVRIYAASNVVGHWKADGSLVIGRVANSNSRIEITSGAISLINRSAGGVDATAISLDASGNASFTGAITANSGSIAGTLSIGASGSLLAGAVDGNRVVIDQNNINFMTTSDAGIKKISYRSSTDYATEAGYIGQVLATSGAKSTQLQFYGKSFQFDSDVTLIELSTTPSNPTSGTQVRLYMKGDKIIIQYNDAGTVRYKYLDLTGTGVTWVHTTTAP